MFDALKELKKDFCFFEESDEYDEEEIKIGKTQEKFVVQCNKYNFFY